MVTGFPYYPLWKKRKEDQRKLFQRESFKNIDVLRGYLYVPGGKLSAIRRLIHELSFCFFAAINFVRIGRPDAIVIFTPPFFLGLVAIFFKWIWRVPLVINVQDLPLDAAVALGMLKPGYLTGLLQRLENWIYRQADLVCSISPTMNENIRKKGVHSDKLKLVPNWIDVRMAEVAAQKGGFIKQHSDLADKFLVAYAGNIGMKQGIDVLLRVAKRIEATPDVHFLIIGEGSDKQHLMEIAKDLKLTNVTFLPFMNHVQYQTMLSDVDVVFVAQRSGAGNNFFPSKLLGLMARSKALLVAADADSELASVIRSSDCGLVCSYDDIDEIAKNVEKMKALGSKITEVGERGRQAATAFDRDNILCDWRSSILDLLRKHTLAG